MLQLLFTMRTDQIGGTVPPFENGAQLAVDDYYIDYKENGLDELHFSVLLNDPAYRYLEEEAKIRETVCGQIYRVKAIDAGTTIARISCQLDVSDWMMDCILGYSSNLAAVAAIEAVCPSGWRVFSSYASTFRYYLRMDGPTPLEVVQEVCQRHGCAVRFSTAAKYIQVIDPEGTKLSSTIIADGLNLLQVNYKGSSADVYTRLYPVGKDGLTIESVNDGVAYIQDLSCVPRVISKLWVDERYTDASSLLRAAKHRLKSACRVSRSWDVDVADLYELSGRSDLLLEMFALIRFIDPVRETPLDLRIVGQRVYPHYPERGKVWLSDIPNSRRWSTQQLTKRLSNSLTDPNSDFWQRLNAR